MDITREQLAVNQDGFRQVVESGAFESLELYFDQHSLLGNPSGASVQDLGEVFIRESGIKSVFRAFREFAEGSVSEVDLFEDENLEDDTASMLN